LALGVATNDGEAPARAHLAAAGTETLFDFIVGSDSGFGGKPAAGQLHGFCDAMGLKAKACAMVGDSTHDLHAGRAAGMATVAVLTGVAGRTELAPHADIVLNSIAELPEWLGI
jgi:phosphoglycolate phosphatase